MSKTYDAWLGGPRDGHAIKLNVEELTDVQMPPTYLFLDLGVDGPRISARRNNGNTGWRIIIHPAGEEDDDTVIHNVEDDGVMTTEGA